MESKSILYSELREMAFNLRSENLIPKTLVFNGGSAFCHNVEDTIFNKTIPTIDELLEKEPKTKYDKSQMRSYKDRLCQIIFAIKNKDFCNIPLNEWRENTLVYK